MSIFKEGRAGTATGGQTYTPFTGDAGSGGLSGLVPAPAAGDMAAGKFLGAGGVWAVPAGGGGSSDSTLLSRIAALEYNIAVNTLRDLVKDGWLGPQAMTYGYADEFTDETGIDVAACINRQYDSGNNLYSSSATTWTQVGTFTYTAANVTKSSSGHAACRSAATYAGDFTFSFTSSFSSLNNEVYFGIYAAAEDATFSTTSFNGSMDSMTNSFWVNSQSATSYYQRKSNGIGVNFTIPSGATVSFARVGNAITCSVNGTQVWSDTFTGGAMRLVVGAYYPNQSYNNITISNGSVTSQDMTLQSVAMTAQAAPTEIRNVLVVEPIDAITPNTDLMLSVSNDGGTTWTPATLTLADKFDATKNIYVAKTAVAAAGTAVKWKIVTANAKQQKVHGIWTQWR